MSIELPKLKKVSKNKVKKPKILLLSDDLRLHSGIATQSKEIVLSTVHKYDWVQLGAALKHPESGKTLILDEDVRKTTGVKDASVKIYCNTGYGTPEVLRQLINIEKPDAILHFTDPRFWRWLYEMENEVRQICPIMYYNIWDSLPDPLWNAPFYASCDLLLGISKQTYGINKRTLEKTGMAKEDWNHKYIPHGVTKLFKPLSDMDPKLVEFKNQFKLDQYDFVVGWNNRNIRRKVPGDVVEAFSRFAEMNPDKKMLLLLHTSPSDPNGTDLKEVIKHCGKFGEYRFTQTGPKTQAFPTETLNLYYNSCDVVLNVASNEGFGLGSCEAMRAGTPIIVNVTGGLQDQCGFRKDGKLLTAEDYVEIGSLHQWRKWKGKLEHGEWVKPVWPTNLSLQGSPVTPYIYDDRCDSHDIADNLNEFFKMGRDECERVGMLGHEFVVGDGDMASETMGEKFIEAIDGCFKNWKPRKRFDLWKV
tara:strand:- start:1847 stop:3271 length:1425 start_codon:yes stop_codon:yes gene_type:complete